MTVSCYKHAYLHSSLLFSYVISTQDSCKDEVRSDRVSEPVCCMMHVEFLVPVTVDIHPALSLDVFTLAARLESGDVRQNMPSSLPPGSFIIVRKDVRD